MKILVSLDKRCFIHFSGREAHYENKVHISLEFIASNISMLVWLEVSGERNSLISHDYDVARTSVVGSSEIFSINGSVNWGKVSSVVFSSNPKTCHR